jgi:hypothetical protein
MDVEIDILAKVLHNAVRLQKFALAPRHPRPRCGCLRTCGDRRQYRKQQQQKNGFACCMISGGQICS